MNDRAGGPAEGGREEKQDPNSLVNTIQSDGGSRPRDWKDLPEDTQQIRLDLDPETGKEDGGGKLKTWR